MNEFATPLGIISSCKNKNRIYKSFKIWVGALIHLPRRQSGKYNEGIKILQYENGEKGHHLVDFEKLENHCPNDRAGTYSSQFNEVIFALNRQIRTNILQQQCSVLFSKLSHILEMIQKLCLLEFQNFRLTKLTKNYLKQHSFENKATDDYGLL